MAEIVVKIPEELEQEMKLFPEIKWNLLVRRFLRSELGRMLELREIVSKSEFTEDDVKELSTKIDTSLSERFLKSRG